MYRESLEWERIGPLKLIAIGSKWDELRRTRHGNWGDLGCLSHAIVFI